MEGKRTSEIQVSFYGITENWTKENLVSKNTKTRLLSQERKKATSDIQVSFSVVFENSLSEDLQC